MQQLSLAPFFHSTEKTLAQKTFAPSPPSIRFVGITALITDSLYKRYGSYNSAYSGYTQAYNTAFLHT